jgi:cytochrome P450
MRAPLMVMTDGTQHAVLRKQVQPAFTKGAMASYREVVDALARELVGAVIDEPGSDVVARLAIPMPLLLIAKILGVPESDIADFRRWSERSVQIMDISANPRAVMRSIGSVAAANSLRRYFMRQLATGGLKGTGTVLGRLLEHSENEAITDDELFTVAILLLIAGNETTTNLLGGLFDTLASHPDQYALIRSRPELIPMAVEEQLRIASPIQNLYRYTVADYEVDGVHIPKGSRVLLSLGAANRDPLVFDEPDEFRADRNPREHLPFGYGTHLCVGAPLARMEGVAILRELTERVEAIDRVGATTWSTHGTLRGPTRLAVKLTPSSAPVP